MIHIETIFTVLSHFLESQILLLMVFGIAIVLKSFILVHLFFKKSKTISYYLLVTILVSAIFMDSEWIFLTIKRLLFNNIELKFYFFWARIAWASTIIFYQSFTLFLESLVQHNFKFSLRNKIFTAISSTFVTAIIAIAIYSYNFDRSTDKLMIETILQKIGAIYVSFPLFLSSLFVTLHRTRLTTLPRILKKQLQLMLGFIIIPYWIFDLLQIVPYILSVDYLFLNTSYAFVNLSNIFITFAIFYCSRKMFGLRFLNWSTQVQSSVDINFMDNFKTILEQFSHVTTMQELSHITQRFFKESFGIPFNRVQLHIRASNQHHRQNITDERHPTITIVEGFMSMHPPAMCDYLKQHKILVYDEMAFSNFYESTIESKSALAFLDGIQADIFLPVFEKDTVIAYIMVDRFARLNTFYTNTEYDEMLIFTRYLGNIIHLMQNKNLDTLIKQEKELQEELYAKHQEISQYKESIRSFLRNHTHKDIGIIFYKNRRFTLGNKAAKELIKVNPNIQEGHPVSKALKQLAQQVEAYKTAQTVYIKDADGTKLVLSGVPSLEHNNVIISVYYPEVTDVIKKQIDMLKDPSEWDYLLYLESTKSGKLINQLIPGTGEMLLNFKIGLLKTSLSKKATLLDMPEQDLQQMVELLHHVSVRETLHTIDLTQPVQNYDVAINLFGINSIFNIGKKNSAPLLEKLDGVGTLFIKNIHFLDLETQEYLAEFLRYGFFRVFKSDTKITGNVRVICSTNQNLQILVQEEKFSKALFTELKHTTLSMPSLTTLPEEELNTLADGFSEQAISNQTYKNLLSLSDKDKHRLAYQRPASLQELKTKVQRILVDKSKQSDIYHELQFDPAYSVSDPELVEAARLGKKALKDQKIMTLLWNKFKNQNKIASFLGVNRSSVNRRCKKYNLIA